MTAERFAAAWIQGHRDFTDDIQVVVSQAFVEQWERDVRAKAQRIDELWCEVNAHPSPLWSHPARAKIARLNDALDDLFRLRDAIAIRGYVVT